MAAPQDRTDRVSLASDSAVQALAPLAHGGDLTGARQLFPAAPEPLIDLSTGINPHSYPVPLLAPEVFGRLPAPAQLERVLDLARQAYGAPPEAALVAAPGTQLLLPRIAALIPPGRAAVLAPTYAEYTRAAALAGHQVKATDNLTALAEADLAVLANPNNPDGRIVPRGAIAELLGQRRGHGLLVVDEAFMDVGPAEASAVPLAGQPGLVVLRSFGKFYGLAGLRLGFAVSQPTLAQRLTAELGPWAVSGPALAAAEVALADTVWRDAMRGRLAQEAARLDAILAKAGLAVVGGTSLFRLAEATDAAAVFTRLGEAGLIVRRFVEAPQRLRFGLPPDEAAWERLAAALR